MASGRNVQRGDRDYSAVNPEARPAIPIYGKAPADWTVRLYIYYTTKAMYDKNSPGEICQYDASGGLEGAMQPYSVEEELPVTRQGETFARNDEALLLQSASEQTVANDGSGSKVPIDLKKCVAG
jgi:hypothetical protein